MQNTYLKEQETMYRATVINLKRIGSTSHTVY